jgi:hypothetical protein
MSAFAFANAGMLFALIALPAIWYLLRLTPPRPPVEQFPPTRLLIDIANKEEQPARSPWWLTALRLAFAAAVVLALAGPTFKPTGEVIPGTGPLILVVDNGWASAPGWTAATAAAHRIVDLADAQSRPIALMATAEPTSQPLEPTDADAVRKRLDALKPEPWAAGYGALGPALAATGTHFGGVVWLSDGLGGTEATAFARTLSATAGGAMVVYADTQRDLFGLKPATAGADALTVPVVRRPSSTAPAEATGGFVRASDAKGRTLGDAGFTFTAGQNTTSAAITLPVELRNDIVRLDIEGQETAGAVQLLDDRFRRRQVEVISGGTLEEEQPLLSPFFYLSRALAPYADVHRPREATVTAAVPEAIKNGASFIVMADVGKLPPETADQLGKWVAGGGMLVRFAGPRLAAATDEALVPVTLRGGERVLGGTMSWQQPQKLASFSATSPFAGLPVPDDVTVNRQVLAEPDGMLAGRTWAALADGTPLVTAVQSGKGWLILFHVTADTSWSNLPLTGTFVEMLRRIVALSASATTSGAEGVVAARPYRLLDGSGHFSEPTAAAEAISGDLAAIAIGPQHPPGLYGSEDGFRALNLLNETSTLAPLDLPPQVADLRPYPTGAATPLAPWFLVAALVLLAFDALAVLWLNGGWRRPRRAATSAAAIAVAAMTALALLSAFPGSRAMADEAADTFALAALDKTHLAYVVTGDAATDATSRAGLHGLSAVLADRTALEPGEPIGIDPAKDELAFFPLIYWPIVASQPAPSEATMARIDAYMRQGGSVIFDTRDQLDRAVSPDGGVNTPAALRLKQMLANLDLPPLEPVPADHVLTKAFYLLNDFPGRYSGGSLWVEASDTQEKSDRPVQAGDGVSTILITENDFAAAWATDSSGAFIFPTVPAEPRQRELAYRAGINIVMYVMTGNYKADQVHVPALLERLGQ